MPGETADVTVVWQALAPMRDDYSVFVHLVNEEGLTIAQADTMPGGGLRPTSEWSAGETRAERYAVTIPPAAYTPDRGRWAVGLYDHKTGRASAGAPGQRGPGPGRASRCRQPALRRGGGGSPAGRGAQPHHG